MSSTWQAVLVKCRYEPRFLPVLLALLRIFISLRPLTGYIHSDEFFQSPEIIAKRHFHSNVQPVWEFTTNEPIRCMLIPSILNSISFKLATTIQTNPSAYLLLVAPRLLYTLLSFVVDYCLYKLCQYYSSRGLWFLPVSVIFQTSFICLVCMTRTFSNVPEVVIFSLLLVVVCRAIRPRFRILFVTPNRRTPAQERIKRSTQLASSLLVGFLVTLGTFNRPTFPAFAFVPLIYWTLESFKRNSYDLILTIYRVIIPVAISSLITAILLSAYDTIFYKDLQTVIQTLEYLMEYKFDKVQEALQTRWVLTPYNFIAFNANVNNLSKFGLHSPYIHMAVNLPVFFNILALMFYAKLTNLMIGSGVYRFLFNTHRVYSLMLLSTLVSTMLLSFIPHQEFRFLLPLIVPLAYAFAFNIYSSNKLLTLWLLYNGVLIYFYSYVHQSGVVSACLDLDPILRSHSIIPAHKNQDMIHVFNLRSYYAPSYQWNIGEEDPRFKFYLQDSFGDFNTSLASKLDNLSRFDDLDGEHQLYFMLPSLYKEDLAKFLHENYLITENKLKLLKQYAPHFTGEDLQLSFDHLKKFGLRSWRTAFGYSLYKLDGNEFLRQTNETKLDN